MNPDVSRMMPAIHQLRLVRPLSQSPALLEASGGFREGSSIVKAVNAGRRFPKNSRNLTSERCLRTRVKTEVSFTPPLLRAAPFHRNNWRSAFCHFQ